MRRIYATVWERRLATQRVPQRDGRDDNKEFYNQRAQLLKKANEHAVIAHRLCLTHAGGQPGWAVVTERRWINNTASERTPVPYVITRVTPSGRIYVRLMTDAYELNGYYVRIDDDDTPSRLFYFREIDRRCALRVPEGIAVGHNFWWDENDTTATDFWDG